MKHGLVRHLAQERAGYIKRPEPTEWLKAASAHALNYNGIPNLGNPYQVETPGQRQPFPNTAVDLIAALGATGVILPANVLAIYQCDTASPLVDSLGLGPNLVAAGGPLTGRECCGLPDTTFVSKVGVEIASNVDYFGDAGTSFGNVPDNEDRSYLFVMRMRQLASSWVYCRVLSKENGFTNTRWVLWAGGAGIAGLQLRVDTPSGGVNAAQINVADVSDGAWHSYGIHFDGTTRLASLYSDIGDGAPLAAYLDQLTAANTHFRIGYTGAAHTNPGYQVAYLAVLNAPLTSAQRAAFWRAFNPAGLGTPNAYARNYPLVCPISASRVACYMGGNTTQLAVGYSPGFLTDGNAGQTGIVCENGATFEPIGSTDQYTNATASGASTKTSVDGASGMRDGVRITCSAAWSAAGSYLLIPPASVGIAGASNIPWRCDVDYRRALVNTTARVGLYFTGSGAGIEFFTLVADAASPVDWVRNGGAATPVNADQTNYYVFLGAAANLDDCDFSELAVIRNRATPTIAWRRVGTAAAATTGIPQLQISNLTNRHNADRGALEIKLSSFQGTNGATFFYVFDFLGNPVFALDYDAGQLRLRLWDDAAALAATVLCGPLGTGGYHLKISWDHAYPVPGAGGAYVLVEQINVGASPTVLGTWMGPGWTTALIAPGDFWVGRGVAAASSARCFISLC